MIAANELRIGNWYSDTNNHNQKVRNIVYGGVNHWQDMGASGEDCYNDISPIPLTEEILLKCGFILRGIYYHFPNHDIFKLEQYRNKNAYWLRHSSESLDSVRINYLHQLQNLYFALTGEELIISL